MGFHQGPVRIFGAFHLQQWMGGEYLPSGSLSAMYGISKSSDSSVDVASFGLNVSSSRWQAFGFGAMAKGVISIGENQFVTLYLMADHLQGLVTPDTGRALSVRGGLLYVIW